MLKKIATRDLTLGTFVADIGQSWFKHPWKTKSKMITAHQDIQELLDYGILEVTIDPARAQFRKVEPSPAPPNSLPTTVSVPKKTPIRGALAVDGEVAEEMPRATQAYNQALDTSSALIAACRMNKKIEIEVVQEDISNLVDSISRNRDALMALRNLRRADDYTYTHCLNVSVLAISTGKALGLSDQELQVLGLGAMLHDLGKTRIPGYILNKPGKLSDKEFTIMRNHASLSSDIIADQNLRVDELVYNIARHHHERMDGSGYPDHLQGNAIHPLVTICALSDVYDALTSDRVYHAGRHPHDALKLIYSLRDTHFPAEWVDRFVQSVGIYPPGTVVLLNTGQIAVVVDINQAGLSTPKIKLVADDNGMLYSQIRIFDLADPQYGNDIKIQSVLTRNQVGFDPANYFKPSK